MWNRLTAVPKSAGPMAAAIIRTNFAQPDTAHVFAQFHEAERMLSRSHPKVAGILEDAKDDILTQAGKAEAADVRSPARQ